MLRRRIASAAVGAPLLLLAIWQGGAALWLLSVALAWLAGREWLGLIGKPVAAPAQGLFYLGLFLLIGVGALPAETSTAGPAAGFAGLLRDPLLAAGLVVVTVLSAWTIRLLLYPAALRLPGGAGGIIFGLAYVGLPLVHWPALRNFGEGLPGVWAAGPVLWVLAVVWANDMAAYGAGTVWGRHRLAPYLSPRKSVEGAAAGLFAAVTVAWLLHGWAGLPQTTAAGSGALVALAGQLGDLWESALKRGAGVKDSGALIPGHGGVLDRFDAIIFALPVAHYLLLWSR
ncbi:MAG: phosphatidate cytidylyltransferase [Thermaerobacterales bacterium]